MILTLDWMSALPTEPASLSQMGINWRFGNGRPAFANGQQKVCHNLVRFWM